jgi:hypothetical protein
MSREPENLMTLDELALKCQRSSHTILAILRANGIAPIWTKNPAGNGRPRKCYRLTAKLGTLLRRAEKPLSDIEAATLRARTIRLRIQNDAKVGVLVLWSDLDVAMATASGTLKSRTIQIIQHVAPAELNGATVAKAREFAEQAIGAASMFFNEWERPFRHGPNRRPDLDLGAIASNAEPLPEAGSDRQAWQVERLRKLRDANAVEAARYFPRVEFLNRVRRQRAYALPRIRALLVQEWAPRVITFKVIWQAREYSIAIWDRAWAIFAEAHDREWPEL